MTNFTDTAALIKTGLCIKNFGYKCRHLATLPSSPMLKMINYAKPKLLLVLAELGDHDEDMHNPALISEFRFVPNQNEEFEIDVLEAYKKNK